MSITLKLVIIVESSVYRRVLKLSQVATMFPLLSVLLTWLRPLVSIVFNLRENCLCSCVWGQRLENPYPVARVSVFPELRFGMLL